MSLLRLLEFWAEGLLRIVIGGGLLWIGVVEGAGYGLFLQVVGVIFVAAGVAEIWQRPSSSSTSRNRGRVTCGSGRS